MGRPERVLRHGRNHNQQEEKHMKTGTYVVITTEKRGVFAGKLAKQSDEAVVLKETRMCVYWSRDVKGVMGLAAGGPTAGCKISRAVPSGEFVGVTAVLECSDDAQAAWESAPWS